jgi:hypothetical protein
MSLRSWAIRGLILTGVAALAFLGWLARSWVSPEHIRAQVIASLSEQFEGVDVHVGDARLRLFGGIAVTDVRLTRPGAETPFLVVPTGVLSHDKEQLNRGRLVIKKVELNNPEFNLERGPDGKWNIEGLLKAETPGKPTPSDKPVPMFVMKSGTIHITDHSADPLPPLTLTDAQLTLLNDPLTVLALQAKVTAEGFGHISVRGRLNRTNGAVSMALEMPEFPLGDSAKLAAEKYAPTLAPHLQGLNASAAVTADLTYTPDAAKKWGHDIRLEIKDAKYTHAEIPWPVEKINASIRIKDGKVTLDDANAAVNGAKVKVAFETKANLLEAAVCESPTNCHPDETLQRLEDFFQRIDVAVSGVTIDDDLVKRLPERAKETRRLFSPVGKVDLGYKFTRDAGTWKRELEFRPKQITAMYEKFKYPVADLRGWAKRTDTSNGPPVVAIDLIGTAGGQLITIKGSLIGAGTDPGINLRITGANFAMDETLVKAFPPKYVEFVRQFRATGRGDFVAEFVQQPGVNLCENEFRVDVRDATVNHVELPYPLEKVKGRLVIRTTTSDPTRPLRPGEPLTPHPYREEIVLDGFTAVHAGAAVWLNGSKRSIPNSRDKKLTLRVGGNNCPVDADLRAAATALKVDSVWEQFQPKGRISFAADVEIIDRAAPLPQGQVAAGGNQPGAVGTAPTPEPDGPPLNPTTDLKLTFNFSGPTVTPTFFPYEMTDLAGWLEYKNGRVDVAHVTARHGQSRLKLNAAEVRLYPDGTVWANLGGIEAAPFIVDEALVKALPGQLATGLEALKFKGGADLVVKHMVVLEPPAAKRAATVKSPVAAPEIGNLTVAARQEPSTPAAAPATPTIYWDAELRLADASFDTGVPWEQVYGAVGCRGRYDGTHTGLMRGAVWFDRAVIARQPVTRISGRMMAAPQAPDPARPGDYLPVEVEFTDIAGDLFHGVLGGQGRVVLTDAPRYHLWLTATDIQLDEVAKHYRIGSDADLKGIAQAQLLLTNRPDPKTGQLVVEGSGKIDVPTGRMYNLPVLLDLVKVLKLQAPDKTAFEEAHATFRIQGDRVKVDQVDLIGKALCLGGSGELDTTGEFVKFDFYTLGSQVLARMINTPVGDLTAFLSKNLFRIKLTRENGELKYRPEAVPLVTEPARLVADRLRARAARMLTGGAGGTK